MLRFEVWAPYLGPYTPLPCEVWARSSYLIYSGYRRNPDEGSVLRAHALDIHYRASAVDLECLRQGPEL